MVIAGSSRDPHNEGTAMMRMSKHWTDRSVLVTGATRGIGRATALHFAERGAHVVVHGRDDASAESVVAEITTNGGSASYVVGDLRDADTCRRIVGEAAQRAGRLDALVNNAGANVFRGTLTATVEEWDECLNLDLRSVWLCAAAAAAVMVAGSAIINVTSNHAVSTLPGVFPYNVAKAGVNALTQSLSIELAERGIRVVGIAPGYIDTPINEEYFRTFPDPAAARARAEALHPLGRLGHADEIAAAIEFFADSRRSGFTTGVVVTVDGGRSALLQDPEQVPALSDESQSV